MEVDAAVDRSGQFVVERSCCSSKCLLRIRKHNALQKYCVLHCDDAPQFYRVKTLVITK